MPRQVESNKPDAININISLINLINIKNELSIKNNQLRIKNIFLKIYF